MLSFKQSAIALAVIGGAVTLAACSTLTNNSTNQSASSQVVKYPVSFLFAIDAKHAEMKHIAARQYQLTIKDSNIRKVLAYSDRPNRIAKIIPVDKYAQMVFNGQNNFQQDPPNIVLDWAKYPQNNAYTISHYQRTANHITYYLTSLVKEHPIAHRTGQVTLYIDSSLICNSSTDSGNAYQNISHEVSNEMCEEVSNQS